jgi:fructokinase
MNHKEWFKFKHSKPVCIGTGLVALDVVINGDPNSPPKLWTGGSCGNVLTILSYLGWKSYPLARLRDDVAAEELLKDLERWKVRTILISRNDSGSTPIIIEKIGTNRSGIAWHRFEWVCPNCGSWFPRYKPVLARDIGQISMRIPQSQVFYFDRVVRSSIELAKMNKSKGALIVFEPSGINDKKLFYECLDVADIVKFSHERLGHAQELIERINVPLEIETLGAGGLRYRIDGNGKRSRKWKTMRSYPVVNLKDAAGAGDWCSAGIIHLLGSAGRKGFEKADAKDIDAALSFGQALAALNCYYEGARGSMYSTSKRKFKTLIRGIWNGTSPLESIEERETIRTSKVIRYICPYCGN